MNRVLLPLVALLALVLGGCGGGSGARDALAETAGKLGDIRSGTLTLEVRIEGTGQVGGEAGFELEGPFGFGEAGELPQADIAYRRIAGSQQAEARFVSTGEKAFVEVGGETYELPDSMVADLRTTEGGSGSDSGLGELDIGDWLVDPQLSDGGEVGGAETDRVSSRLDVVAAVNDLLGVVRDLGVADLGQLDGERAEQLRRAVTSSSIDIWTGKDDRLLRKLEIHAKFGASGPSELEQALGELGGAKVTFLLEIADPNEPVHVQAPADAVPYPG
jgi:hypothetical protein